MSSTCTNSRERSVSGSPLRILNTRAWARARGLYRRLALEILEDRVVPSAVSDEYLGRLYAELLGHSVGPVGLSYWGGLLDAGASRAGVAQGILDSNEHHAYTVEQLYGKLLDRPAEQMGLFTFTSLLDAGLPLEQVQAAILGSGEYYVNAGGTHDGFLGSLYHDVLDRPLDPVGRSAWGWALASGVPLDVVAFEVLTSPEGRGNLVQGWYEHHLHRAADPLGLSIWVGVLPASVPADQVRALLLASDEYWFGPLTDLDGVPDAVENGAPNRGDGNADGRPDARQANVASLPDAAGGEYVTLASPGGTFLANVRARENPSPADAPAGVVFPVGFFDFTVLGVLPGRSTTVKLALPSGVSVETYYKYGPTPDNPDPHWYEFAFDGTTGAEILGGEVRLHLADGLRGDDDLTTNGVIVDAGGPARAAQPGRFAFSSSTYSVGEDDGEAVITVLRMDGSDGEARVAFATSDGSARAGQDYTATSGVLTFAPGQASATFAVPVLRDDRVEGTETVNLTLSNPTGGAALGGQRTARLSILDADRQPPGEPGDSDPPVITAALANDTGPSNADGLTSDPTVAGTVTDAGAVTSFRAGLDDTPTANFADVLADLRPGGGFTLDRARLEAINGGPLAEGPHTLRLVAGDDSNNVSARFDLTFTLDTEAPAVAATAPADGALVDPPAGADLPVEVAFSEPMDGPSVLAALTVTGDRTGAILPSGPTYDGATNTLRFGLGAALLDEAVTVTVGGSASDLAGNALAGGAFTLDFNVNRIPIITAVSPANGEELVSVTRKVVVRFSDEIDPATITSDSLKVIALGAEVPGRRVVSSTERFVTFFPDQPLNPSTEVRVRIDGNLIIGRNGKALDADGDGVAGGIRTADFSTLPLTRIAGTNVFGFVRDSYTGVPIVGATIRVDAFPQANAVTDETGRFELRDMPAPDFFVHVDGSTATNAPDGFAYPNVGKPFHSVPGQTVQLNMAGVPFDIFLPPMALADVQPLSATETTQVGFGASGLSELETMFPGVDPATWQRLQVAFTPGAAVDDFGNAATEAVIIPVPPDRIPAPLPPNLNPQLVISIQAGGATRFDVPAAITFPNLEGLAPGEKTLIFSFDHDAGRWVVVGTGTVSADGLSVVSDPGVGIVAPGWHFVQVGTDTQGDPCEPGQPCVRVIGERGDVIRVDLTGTGGRNFRINTGSFTGGEVAVNGSTVISDGGDVAETGVFYVVPEITGRPQTTTPTGPNVIEGTFTADLEITENGVTRTKTETAIVRVEIMPGYTAFALTGSVGEGGNNDPLDVYRVQQRLKYLGFPNRNGVQLTIDGVSGSNTQEAIRLFQAAIHDDQISPSPIPGFGNPGNDGNPLDTSNGVVGGTTQLGIRAEQWQNAANAPRYVELIDSGNDFDIFHGQNQTERWGTNWAVETIYAATSAVTGTQIITAISEDGYTALHSEHKSGMDIDVNIAGPGRTPGTGPDLTPGEQQVVDEMVAFFNSATVPVARMIVGFPRIANAVNEALGTNIDIVRVDPTGVHDNHFHVDLEPPAIQALPQNFVGAISSAQGPQSGAVGGLSLAGLVTVSTAPGFGDDDRIFYRFQLTNGFEIAGRTNSAGDFSEILTPNIEYSAIFYRASDNRTGVYRGTSNVSGLPTDLGTIILDQFGGLDADGDGIPDVGEHAIGTNPNSRDSDADGITDDAELAQGLDPLDDRGFPTGIISSLPLPGPAQEVVVEGNTAYVATGSHGLAVVDVSRFNNPILLGQIDLTGTATDVDVDPALGLAAVATNTNGVQIIDVSDPMMPEVALVRTNVLGSRVEVAGGVAYVSVGGSLTSIDLLTGDVLETLNLGGTITDIAQEGSFLYTMNTSRQLRVIDITGGNMVARGSVFLPNGGGKLFVGNGIAYAAAADTTQGGYATADVSNPDGPVVLSGTDAPVESAPGTAIVTNGSGIGLLVGQSQRVAGDPSSLQLVNVTDPTNTYDLLLQIGLPTPPSALAVASGIAFVADGTSGLQVINYLPFDNQGQAPTVTISTPVADIDPVKAGIQLVEGTSIPVVASVLDDVQVRNVELIVNGAVVRNDVSFPFDFAAIALSDDPAMPVTTVQVRATDTGGNVALSNVLSFELVPDTFAPTIASIDPADGSQRPEGHRTVRIRFSEPIAAAGATADNFSVFGAGTDGVLGNSDDVPVTVTDVQLRGDDTLVQLTTEPLAVGLYQIRINQDGVTDRAGNVLGTGLLTSDFEVVEAIPITITFDSGSGLPPSYTESGLTVTSRQDHLHMGDQTGDGSPDLRNHSGCCSTPYQFTFAGGAAFSVVSVDVLGFFGSGTFTSSSGAVVTITGTGTINFDPAGWTNITSFSWDQPSGDGIIDNLLILAAPTGSPLLAEGGELAEGDAAHLHGHDAYDLAEEAFHLWEVSSHLGELPSVTIVIDDLPGDRLGTTHSANGEWIITLDATANGAGWFVDTTPWEHSEFATTIGPDSFQAGPGSPAAGRYDLLTVLLHEMGHVLGFEHSHDTAGVMTDTLAPGVRRIPSSDPDLYLPALPAVPANSALASAFPPLESIGPLTPWEFDPSGEQRPPESKLLSPIPSTLSEPNPDILDLLFATIGDAVADRF